MPSKTPEGNGTPELTKDEQFIAEFKNITEKDGLTKYEQDKRERIITASFSVLKAFTEHWDGVIGKPYLTIKAPRGRPPIDKKQRFDPKSRGYKGYWEITFQPKAHPNDFDDVTLSVNGQCLQMKREEAVILPGRFLEAADNAVYPTYSQRPGHDRKITGFVKFFPYIVLREADEDEYRKMKADGDKVTADARREQEMEA